MLGTGTSPIYKRILEKRENDVAAAIEWVLSLHMFPGLRPGEFKDKFTSTEDAHLRDVVERVSTRDWIRVANQMPLRTPRQCRERWTNYLSPTIENSEWTVAEDQLLDQKLAELGTKWKLIAKFFPARSKNNIKYRWFRRQKIKARVEAAQGKTTVGSSDSGNLAAKRDSVWGGITFEKGSDSAVWDALAEYFL
jgi:hypothetical protein